MSIFRFKQKHEQAGIHYLEAGENFNDLWLSVNEICMYTVNSYELYNRINALLEQKANSNINKLTILVRKKIDETEEDLSTLKDIIDFWKKWVEKGRIRKLTIIGYNYDPDHYYTILGDKVVFSGHVYFDESKPTKTNISYSPIVFSNDTEIGRQAIKNFRAHFDNVAQRFEQSLTLVNKTY